MRSRCSATATTRPRLDRASGTEGNLLHLVAYYLPRAGVADRLAASKTAGVARGPIELVLGGHGLQAHSPVRPPDETLCPRLGAALIGPLVFEEQQCNHFAVAYAHVRDTRVCDAYIRQALCQIKKRPRDKDLRHDRDALRCDAPCQYLPRTVEMSGKSERIPRGASVVPVPFARFLPRTPDEPIQTTH
jgi:hypothetical protein